MDCNSEWEPKSNYLFSFLSKDQDLLVGLHIGSFKSVACANRALACLYLQAILAGLEANKQIHVQNKEDPKKKET